MHEEDSLHGREEGEAFTLSASFFDQSRSSVLALLTSLTGHQTYLSPPPLCEGRDGSGCGAHKSREFSQGAFGRTLCSAVHVGPQLCSNNLNMWQLWVFFYFGFPEASTGGTKTNTMGIPAQIFSIRSSRLHVSGVPASDSPRVISVG